MLAHNQAGVLNASKLASALLIDVRTLNRYLDLIDLVLEFTPTRRWAIEIKRSTAHPAARPPGRGSHSACDDINAERRIVVYPGRESFPQANGVETLPLQVLMRTLSEIQ